MKRLKLLGVCVLFALNICNIKAQDFCTTNSDVEDFLQSIPQEYYKSGSNAYVIRVFIHIIRRSNGTGGQTIAEVNTALNTIVVDYAPYNICFSLLGIDEIHNDNAYNKTAFANDNNGDGKFDDFNINAHSNAIDIYLLANDGNFNGGKASNIPGTALVIGGNVYGTNLASSHVLSHEMGHCLGLYHTFHGLCGESGCAELVNGSNGSSCGDLVQDTPADRQAHNVNQSTCVWSGVTCDGINTDANGDYYSPNTHLFMAYIPPSCMQSHTIGQKNRMFSIIANSSLLQNSLVSDYYTLANTTVSSGQDVLYDTQVGITTQGNVTVLSGGKLTLRAGEEIILNNGFIAETGSVFIAEINSQCSTIDHNNSAKTDETVVANASFNENNNIAQSLSIYPNPSHGKFNIDFYPSDETIYFSVVDMVGQNVLDFKKTYVAGQTIETLDLSNQAEGIYIVTIKGMYYNIAQKIILQNN
ncbi:MAG: hypothetical protein BGO32_00070 [Bacteroidetes bacterium 37-13]|nr:MAG: hypothetical protein BGO32_00070 [Bacteroidetes bacterium 37-13]